MFYQHHYGGLFIRGDGYKWVIRHYIEMALTMSI